MELSDSFNCHSFLLTFLSCELMAMVISTEAAMRFGMAAELDQVTVKKAYAFWAPVYDLVFGPVFERGRRAAIAAAEQIGGRILEVGVGTGISLPSYSAANRIVGID